MVTLGEWYWLERNREFLSCWECSVSPFRCSIYERLWDFTVVICISFHMFINLQIKVYLKQFSEEPQEAFTDTYNLVKTRTRVYFQKGVSGVLRLRDAERGMLSIDDNGEKGQLCLLWASAWGSFCLGSSGNSIQVPSELYTSFKSISILL